MNFIISTALSVLAALVGYVLARRYVEYKLFKASMPSRLAAVDIALDIAMNSEAPTAVRVAAVNLYTIAKSVERTEELMAAKPSAKTEGSGRLGDFVTEPYREPLQRAVHHLATAMLYTNPELPIYMRVAAALFTGANGMLNGSPESGLEARTVQAVAPALGVSSADMGRFCAV